MSRSLVRFGLLATLFACAVGCGKSGPPMGEVNGKVTYQGKPLNTGSITFIPEQQETAAPMAEIREDGTYEVITPDVGKGAPIGKYTVMITAVKDMGPEAPVMELLPAKYGSNQQSGLTADVAEGENTIDFDLK